MTLSLVPYDELIAPPQMQVYGVDPYCSERNRRIKAKGGYFKHGKPVAVLIRDNGQRITRRALCEACVNRLGYDMPGGIDVQ